MKNFRASLFRQLFERVITKDSHRLIPFLFPEELRIFFVMTYVDGGRILSRACFADKPGEKGCYFGIKSDEWVWKYFSDLNVGNLIGKYTLGEPRSFERGKSVVTHDSGPMHGRNDEVLVLSIFGST